MWIKNRWMQTHPKPMHYGPEIASVSLSLPTVKLVWLKIAGTLRVKLLASVLYTCKKRCYGCKSQSLRVFFFKLTELISSLINSQVVKSKLHLWVQILFCPKIAKGFKMLSNVFLVYTCRELNCCYGYYCLCKFNSVSMS